MGKTKREFILATCFVSGAAAILSFVALATQSWVTAEGKWLVDTDLYTQLNSLHYGLFSGVYRQVQPLGGTAELQMTCLVSKNICALLCGEEDHRYEQLRNITEGRNTTFDCLVIARSGFPYRLFMDEARADGTEDFRQFLNAGVWIATIFFLVLSAVMGLVAAGLAVWNAASNPIEIYFSIFGLYVYNSVAFVSILCTILIWGIMFAQTTIHNTAIYHTLVGLMSTDNRAQLGFSYWINLVSLFLYVDSIFLLYFRNYLISKEPKVDVHLEDNADPGIYLY